VIKIFDMKIYRNIKNSSVYRDTRPGMVFAVIMKVKDIDGRRKEIWKEKPSLIALKWWSH
jgi:hypothetical protein